MERLRRFPASGGALLLIDFQERLLASMAHRRLIEANALRLVEAARLLGIPTWATEQYPQGLGPTVPGLAEKVEHRIAKMGFGESCIETMISAQGLPRPEHLTLCGVEGHICVLQTSFALLDQGFRVQVVADAVSSRSPADLDRAFARLERGGVVVTTTETVLFEWIETATHPAFRAISRLVKDFQPQAAPSV